MDHIAYLRALVSRGGPSPEEYESVTRWLGEVARAIRDGSLAKTDLDTALRECGEPFHPSTLQGYGRCKPRGYAGDFEIIDRIYTHHVSADPELAKWDHYFHAQRAVRAVRNRKAYFVALLGSVQHELEGAELRVLNLASGPARDVAEYLNLAPTARASFVCVEQDAGAIAHAKKVCAEHLERVRFEQRNVFRFNTSEQFSLVWSAGLFDYLDDHAFCHLLRRYYARVEDGGQLVIGNFGPDHSTQNYMELIGEWYLRYRNAGQLTGLALHCGIDRQAITVRREPEGVNLFLHIRKGCAS